MCGICGIVRAAPDEGSIERMTRSLSHRGPDFQDIWRDSGVALGHTRLSILDLSPAGNQPMRLGHLTLTYNGEISPFRQLREQLPGPFRSDGDSEVLLHLYAQHGPSCLEMLRGMFSFAIWNSRDQTLFAARDRVGMKPFFYRELSGGIAFASEIKALLELGCPAIDRLAVRDYLTYKYVPEPKTAFSGIRNLPPGHSLLWDGSLKIERYWSPATDVTVTDFTQAVEELDALLSEVVPAHTLADVPVA